ncbi:polC [Symbiodinium sp. CCMP2456]|nr:polC [Symbiodinium sp. CCMP2456]
MGSSHAPAVSGTAIEPQQSEHEAKAPENPAAAGLLHKSMTAANWWRLLPLEPAKFTRVVVFDTETSGFSNDDEILEIGAIELEVQPPSLQSPPSNYSTLSSTGVSFHSLLRPTRRINSKASEVNGLCENLLTAAAPRKRALQNFLRFISGSKASSEEPLVLEQTALIAHNAAFDMRMLSNDLQRCGLHHCSSRLRQHLFCSAEAFGALRPSSPRDLTTATCSV